MRIKSSTIVKAKVETGKKDTSCQNVAFFIALMIVWNEVKHNNKIKITIYSILFVLFLSITALGLLTSCYIIDSANAKLAILAGIGWLIVYWLNKNKELGQQKYEIKQKQYAEYIEKAFSAPNEYLEVITAKTLIIASSNVADNIKEYKNKFNEKNFSEIKNHLQEKIMEEMRQDLLMTNIDLVDFVAICFNKRKDGMEYVKSNNQEQHNSQNQENIIGSTEQNNE